MLIERKMPRSGVAMVLLENKFGDSTFCTMVHGSVMRIGLSRLLIGSG
jgi:hypothetical protein